MSGMREHAEHPSIPLTIPGATSGVKGELHFAGSGVPSGGSPRSFRLVVRESVPVEWDVNHALSCRSRKTTPGFWMPARAADVVLPRPTRLGTQENPEAVQPKNPDLYRDDEDPSLREG